MHKSKVSALCNRDHYCIIRVRQIKTHGLAKCVVIADHVTYNQSHACNLCWVIVIGDLCLDLRPVFWRLLVTFFQPASQFSPVSVCSRSLVLLTVVVPWLCHALCNQWVMLMKFRCVQAPFLETRKRQPIGGYAFGVSRLQAELLLMYIARELFRLLQHCWRCPPPIWPTGWANLCWKSAIRMERSTRQRLHMPWRVALSITMSKWGLHRVPAMLDLVTLEWLLMQRWRDCTDLGWVPAQNRRNLLLRTRRH